MTRAWRNQPDVRKWFLDSSVISTEQHQRWFEHYRDRDDDFVFIIEETERLKRPVGQVSLYAIDWEGRRAKFGRLMIGDAQARGRGLALRAVETLVRHAEHGFGLRELRLEVFDGNDPAIAIYQRCGFITTGRVNDELRMVRRSPVTGAQ